MVIVLWCVVSVMQAVAPAPGSQPVGAIDRYLPGLMSSDWKARSAAFYDLLKLGAGDRAYVAAPIKDIIERATPADADRFKVALIRLLETENEMVEGYKESGRHFGEDYSNYYGDVIAAVATLKDPRSMNGMLGALDTGGMAIRTLVSFAPTSVGPLIEKLSSSDATTRMFILDTLCEMLLPPNDEKVQGRRPEIKLAFLGAVHDSDPNVRAAGARGLGLLGDRDAIPVLRDLAERDPAFLAGEADGGKDLYIVRPEAEKALREILAKQKAR